MTDSLTKDMKDIEVEDGQPGDEPDDDGDGDWEDENEDGEPEFLE